MNSILIQLVAAVTVCLGSCSCPRHQAGKHVLTEAQAIELAKQEFVKTGRRVEEYQLSAERDEAKRKWMVWFQLKSTFPPPGTTHAVAIEDKTRRAIFMPGE